MQLLLYTALYNNWGNYVTQPMQMAAGVTNAARRAVCLRYQEINPSREKVLISDVPWCRMQRAKYASNMFRCELRISRGPERSRLMVELIPLLPLPLKSAARRSEREREIHRSVTKRWYKNKRYRMIVCNTRKKVPEIIIRRRCQKLRRKKYRH